MGFTEAKLKEKKMGI